MHLEVICVKCLALRGRADCIVGNGWVLLHKAAFFPEPYSGATIVRLMLSKVLS